MAMRFCEPKSFLQIFTDIERTRRQFRFAQIGGSRILSCEMSENARSEPLEEKKSGSMLSEFMEEVPRVWKALPHKLLFGILLLAWIALFQFWGNSSFGYYDTKSMFVWLNTDYTQMPDDEHGKIVPLIILAILWIKREPLLKAAGNTWWPAYGLLLFAIALHLAGHSVQQVRVSAVAFGIGLYALTGIVWGRQWMARSFFPMFLLVFCVPLSTLSEAITFPLRLFVTKISVGIAHTGLGIDVYSAGSQIMDGRGHALYDVAPACSGMRSLIAMGLITIIYSFLTFESNFRRLIVVASALPFAVLGNIARVTTVILVGEAFGKDAGAMIEQKFGFLTFGIAIGCMLGVGWLLRENRKEKPPDAPLPMEAAI
jgi:exosortase